MKEKEIFTDYKAYFLLIPLLVFLTGVIIIPFLYLINYSFRAYNLALPQFHGQFIGLENYKKLLGDPQVWWSLKLTLWFVFLVVSIEFILALFIALLLNRDFKGENVIKAIIILPSMLPPILVALIWRFLLIPRFGIALYYLRQSGIVGSETAVFSYSTLALYVIVLIDIWQWTPFLVLILLAGLSSLPMESFEAATVDGASSVQKFIYLTLPLMKPVIIIAILFRVITALKALEKVYLLTGGGPGRATDIMNMFAYRINFRFWDFGYGSTVVLLILLVSLMICIFLIKAISSVRIL